MTPFQLIREQWLDRPIDEVFPFFADAGKLEAITPPWLNFQILTPRPIEMRAGALIRYSLRWRVVPIRWTTEITRWDPPYSFVDEQLRGPYRLWRHLHEFEACDGRTRMRDTVDYALYGGPFGRLAHAAWVRRDLERIFDYRARRVAELLGTVGRDAVTATVTDSTVR